ncbi:alpha/beta hydrolase-fold protein [Nonomuraea dietziae]|uniref:alpha/beta hydrolase-fold protein n=1 Tax=Nonomuraea dietziae TaxID=65515 RepID=UPI003426BF28
MVRWGWIGALAALVIAATTALPGQAVQDRARPGTITAATAPSPALGEPVAYNLYLPGGYAEGKGRYPVLYLLHGRGDTKEAWTRVKSSLDDLIAAKRIPPLIAVMPDAPWSERGNWYVDSRHTGGKPVETAFTRDLVQHVDATYRTAPLRNARLVGGYSMGGAGALRYVLAHQDLFAGAIVLSPAVYTPLPPADSSTREYGAFGDGDTAFSEKVYTELNYPALLGTVDPDLPTRLFIAVGDDEYANPDPAEARHDLDFESAALYNAVRRVPGLSAELRVMDGGHDWSVWAPAFEQAMTDLGAGLSVVPPTPLPGPPYGGAGADWAGGVAVHADGSTTVGYAESGQSRLDAVVKGAGWTARLSTSADERLYGLAALPDGGVLAAGYTKGDLDGRHAGNATDDAFVARLDASGKVTWITQFGVAGAADRLYGLAAAPDGGAYVTGYTKGDLAGPNRGDKDAVLARLAPDGRLAWTRQFGGSGEDKAYGVAAGPSGVHAVGSTTAGFEGAAPLGGLDGWTAGYAPDGTLQWTSAVGGPGEDRLNGVAVTTAGLAVVTGVSGGDLLAQAYTATGRRSWSATVATPATDEGAAVAPLAGGEVEIVGYTRGRVGVVAGGADILTVRLDGRGRQRAAAQLGSARDDGVDPFAEPNLYAATAPSGKVAISGLTYGGGGDGGVFQVTVDPATGLP